MYKNNFENIMYFQYDMKIKELELFREMNQHSTDLGLRIGMFTYEEWSKRTDKTNDYFNHRIDEVYNKRSEDRKQYNKEYNES